MTHVTTTEAHVRRGQLTGHRLRLRLRRQWLACLSTEYESGNEKKQQRTQEA